MAKKRSPTMPAASLVLQALHGIKAEVKGLRGELVKTNERLDQTNQRLDQTVERLDRLDRRVTEGFLETNTKIAELSGRVVQLGDRLENVLTGQMGQDVRDLRSRMVVVEERLSQVGVHERPLPYGETR